VAALADLFLAAGLFGAAAHAYQAPATTAFIRQGAAEARPQPPNGERINFRQQVQDARWILWSAHPAKGTVRVFLDTTAAKSGHSGRAADLLVQTASSPLFLDHLPVAADADIRIDGQKAKLGDLKDGMRLTLRLAAEKSVVTKIDATRPRPQAVVKAVDAGRRIVTVEVGEKNVDLPVGADAILQKNGVKLRLEDIKSGMPVRLILGPSGDRMVVTHITVDR
jgi:hypothetical protein